MLVVESELIEQLSLRVIRKEEGILIDVTSNKVNSPYDQFARLGLRVYYPHHLSIFLMTGLLYFWYKIIM